MAIAESLKVDYADFDKHQSSDEAAKLIPQEFAQQYRAVVYSAKDDTVVLASDQPTSSELLDAAKKLLPKSKIQLRYALTEEVDEELVNYRKPLKNRFSEIVEQGERVAPTIIDAVIADAVALRASDIHFEPDIKEVEVRMRIDGVLQDVGTLGVELYQSVLNKIKVMANMRIDEHGRVQDGAIRYDSDLTGEVDMRVSIAPTVSGEKIVIRLLNSYSADLTLVDLGLSDANQAIIETAGKKPFGMVVITGPTGSGKTTTLYSLIKKIKNRRINITTIEDPVEYKIPGIAQIQVNPETNLTFSEGLRSIVRQDPDVVLIGEIRDAETAEIAVNAGLTGHLMLTTFHANDAATAIPRLLELGTEPFLLASTLEVVVAQRLLRKLCLSCRVSTKIDLPSFSKRIGLSEQSQAVLSSQLENLTSDLSFYTSKGCNVCNNTGYKGRIGNFEIIALNDSIKELILTKPSRNEIWEEARRTGARTLFEDGLDKVRAGQTNLEELLRVVPMPQVKPESIKSNTNLKSKNKVKIKAKANK